MTPPRVAALHAVFFLSGSGALVFENVWFSQIGWIVGNSVWSAALVVAAFMAGLALGNGAALLLAPRLRNLLRGYAAMEAIAAVSGAAAVFVFPLLPALASPLLAPLLDSPAALDAARAAIAFGLMALPATALGATLPLVTKPLESASGSYGYALGSLYGVNTLGAVAGTLAAEFALIPALGLQGSGLAAAACNAGAALIALAVARRAPLAPAREARAPGMPGRVPARILLAAFLAGAALLGLEVVWFRFLLLFHAGTTLMFAVMLAVVLAGIALGGLAAARAARRGGGSARTAKFAAAAAALAVVAAYASFHFASRHLQLAFEPDGVLVAMSLWLMAPACFFSGVLFTALGISLRGHAGDAVSATGLLTVANTLGAMAGSLVAGFVLLPQLGMEASLFVLAAAYALVVLAAPDPGGARGWRLAAAALALAALAVFPFGRLKEAHYAGFERDASKRLVALREGVAETAFYFEYRFLGEALYHQLATNSHSMSASDLRSQRYMKLFAYLPAALHPRLESVLVICFGVGNTAAAAADLPDVKAIDVVDVSRDILELGDIAHPDPRRHPLRDPRARVRVEDGRFVLQHSARRYDLITGEPPPPKMARVVSLYTREYFGLVHERLNPGGIATHWLPVHQLLPGDVRAIVGAFCGVFEDCSLWSGAGLDWMLMGSRGGIRGQGAERFSRLWRHPRPGAQLRRIGVETPGEMLGLFMADAPLLRQLAAAVPPLVDNFPHRLSPVPPATNAEPMYVEMMDPDASLARFRKSAWAASIAPAALADAAERAFAHRGMLDRREYPPLQPAGYSPWADAAAALGEAGRVALPRWLLGSDADRARIAGERLARSFHPVAAEHAAIDALARRRPPVEGFAGERFAALTPMGQAVTLFHLCVAGEAKRARALMAALPAGRRAREPFRSFLSWAQAGC